MKNVVFETSENQMVLKINRKGFDERYLFSLLKRLQIEELAQKSDFDPSIENIADQIKQEWWDRNGEDFLKGV